MEVWGGEAGGNVFKTSRLLGNSNFRLTSLNVKSDSIEISKFHFFSANFVNVSTGIFLVIEYFDISFEIQIL